MDPAAPHTNPNAACSPQDLAKTGFSANACWRVVVHLTVFPMGTPLVCKFNDTSVWPSSDPYSALTSQGTQRWLNPTITNKSDLTVTCYNLTG